MVPGAPIHKTVKHSQLTLNVWPDLFIHSFIINQIKSKSKSVLDSQSFIQR